MNQRKGKGLSLLFSVLVALFLCGLTSSVQAQGGPPMLTDDPGTPGDGRWEVNSLATLERSREGSIYEAPNIDLNYGLGQHIQLKFEAPWLVMKNNGERMKTGTGNSMVGVKWRFLDKEQHGLDMSIYPQLEFNNPTRSVERGLVEKGLRLFFPVEAVKTLGPVEINGEVGYRVVQHATDELEYGLAIARQVTRRVELIGELHGTALRTLREDELFFNIGLRLRLNRMAALLFSAGRTIRQAADEGSHDIAAFGIQFNFAKRLFNSLSGK